jgi:hypothetical protein
MVTEYCTENKNRILQRASIKQHEHFLKTCFTYQVWERRPRGGEGRKGGGVGRGYPNLDLYPVAMVAAPFLL